jgi:autotransporter-associated beta strand protein
MRKSCCLAAAAMIAACEGVSFGQLAAFPGAVGFGADTTGGRGGSVYVVTNLNDSGPGSFRDAVSEPNRIVVFSVGGYIDLQSAVSCSSNITILGQTAPGQGIGFEGHEVSFSDQSNANIQYVRFREGSTDTSAKASLNLGDLNGGIIDHVSAEFSQYDNIDAVGANSAADNITYSNDLIADPIKAQQLNLHEEGNQTTYIANIFANAHGRDPLAKSNDQYINNVCYNYGYAYTTGNSAGTFKYDILNNYFISGPSTTSPGDAWYQLDSNQSAYASGNMLDSNDNGILDGSPTTPGGVTVLSQEWSPTTQYLPTLSATNAYSFDVAHAGDSLSRDQVDSLIISQVQSLGTAGSIYNEQDDDGLSNNGFGTIAGGTAPTNTAGDGIADSWKITHGLNVNVADSTLLDALGYTMIEEYAQQLGDEYASQTWSSAGGDWTTGAWSAQTPGIYDHALIRGNGASNGSVSLSGSDSASAFTVSIGGNGPAAGESLNISGGSLTVQDTIYVGDQNNGSLSMSGGSVRCNNIQLGNTVFNTSGVGTTYTGTFNFTGGTLNLVYEIVQGGGSPGNWTTGGVFHWSGGTLVGAGGELLVNVGATLGSGGAIVNTNGAAGTFSGVLSGTGSFTKLGTGVAGLTQANSYSGGTVIDGGALKAYSSSSLGSGLITINTGDGLQLANGVNISEPITDEAGASEAIDVPDANASAIYSGNLTVVGGASQYRMGISGAGSTLTLTGQDTAGSQVSLITRGNIIFAGTASLTVTGAGVEIGRFSPTSSLNLTLEGSASINATSIALGGLDGSSDDLNTTVTLSGNAMLNAGAGSFNIDNSATASNTTSLTLTGTSAVEAGNVIDTSTTGTSTVNINGGTIIASANDPAAGYFLPHLPSSTFDIGAGGGTLNNGGFNITIAQPLLNAGGSGGLTANGTGTTTLLAANTYTGPTTISAGTLVIGTAGALPVSSAVTVDSAMKLAGGIGQITLTSLSLSAGASVDVTSNPVFIDYGSTADPMPQIESELAAGRIFSSTVASLDASQSQLVYAVGVADSADQTDGSLISGQIEILPTLAGDATLSGNVDFGDFQLLAQFFGSSGNWDQGNFTYGPTIDFGDFQLLAQDFGATSSLGTASELASLNGFAARFDDTLVPNSDGAGFTIVSVPEPASAGLLAMAALGVFAGRKRRKKCI